MTKGSVAREKLPLWIIAVVNGKTEKCALFIIIALNGRLYCSFVRSWKIRAKTFFFSTKTAPTVFSTWKYVGTFFIPVRFRVRVPFWFLIFAYGDVWIWNVHWKDLQSVTILIYTYILCKKIKSLHSNYSNKYLMIFSSNKYFFVLKYKIHLRICALRI